MAEEVNMEDSDAQNGEHSAEEVECDFCTGRKRKAKESCLMCLASYCKTHVKSHYQSPAFKKHKLVKASRRLQDWICSQHGKLMEIYCRTDRSFICYLCMMDKHKGHDMVEAETERTEKQGELKKMQTKCQQRLQEKEEQLQELKQSVDTVKRSAQAAVDESEKIFTELIRSIQRERSDVAQLIRAQEKAQLSQTAGPLKQLEQEVAELRRRHAELEQILDTEDHVHFLESFPSLSLGCVVSPSTSIAVTPPLSFEGVRESLCDLKVRLEEFCKEELGKIRLVILPKCGDGCAELDRGPEGERCVRKASVRPILTSKPKTRGLMPSIAVLPILPSTPTTREDFLQYFCPLTMDPNTVYHKLILSEEDKVVKWRGGEQRYADHPDRFDRWPQVLCKESLSGRCYWEVEWNNGGWGVSVSVSYKDISRKGDSDECAFGGNSQSWSLLCSSVFSLWHNNVETKISGPSTSRIGVYLDHGAGTLSFYGVSDTMTLLHTVHATFAQPLYAGFWMKWGTVKLCDPNSTSD